jgi:hypothetical protein
MDAPFSVSQHGEISSCGHCWNFVTLFLCLEALWNHFLSNSVAIVLRGRHQAERLSGRERQ